MSISKIYLNRYEQNALAKLMNQKGLSVPFVSSNSIYYFPDGKKFGIYGKEIKFFNAENITL